MSGALTLGLFSWVGDFFKSLFDLIPKIIYLLYASLACLLDILQLFFRKLAGLDVYYVDGVPQTGDLVTNFIGGILGININGNATNIDFSPLATVFWSMFVFGLIICFMSVFIAIIKSHYTYDAKTTPMQIVYTGGKAIINMIAVPIIIILGLFVSQALLTALDRITSVSSGTIKAAFGASISEFKEIATVASVATGNNADTTYIYYDLFGYGGKIRYSTSAGIGEKTSDKDLALIGSMTQTFSGSLFNVAAYNANRARLGQFTMDGDDFGGRGTIFTNANTNNGDQKKLANLIDMCFANNLHLKEVLTFPNYTRHQSKKYFTNFLCRSVENFSKFNVGAVWYYYDLWEFNFIVGFAGCIVCSTIFINIVMGLMTRLIMCVALFLVYPPVFGLAPIKDAAKGWRDNFMKNALMAYGSVVGMNIVMMILPYLNEIDFFNIEIADFLAQTMFIIVGLISIKAVMAVMSELIGGADANDTGGKIAEEVGQVAAKAGAKTLGVAKGVVKAPVAIAKGAKGAVQFAHGKGEQFQSWKANKAANREEKKAEKAGAQGEAIANASDAQIQSAANTMMTSGLSKREQKSKVINDLVAGGMSKKEAKNVYSGLNTYRKENGGNFGSMADLQMNAFGSAASRQSTATANHDLKKQRATLKAESSEERLNKAAKNLDSFSSNIIKPVTGTFGLLNNKLTKGVQDEYKSAKEDKDKKAQKEKDKASQDAQKAQQTMDNKGKYLDLRSKGIPDDENPYKDYK